VRVAAHNSPKVIEAPSQKKIPDHIGVVCRPAVNQYPLRSKWRPLSDDDAVGIAESQDIDFDPVGDPKPPASSG